MTTITVSVLKTSGTLGVGITFGGTNVVVKDNSGAVLPGVLLTGKENPPWVATFTGNPGPNEAQATITDVDTNGNTIGTPLVVTETGTGGIPQSFSQTAGATITVA